MKMPSVTVFALLMVAAPARAATITWIDDGALTSSSGGSLFPGLTVGTPWTLEVSFDPDGPGAPAPGAPPGSNCNVYSMTSTTFTLGAFTYTNSGGKIWTNSNLPGLGCNPTPNGAIQFEWTGSWVQEPGAWNLNSGVMIAGYTDAVHSDGTLPTVPALTGFNSGIGFYNLASSPFPAFQDRTFAPSLAEQPMPVPEPGTLAMLSLGLAYAGRRRLNRK